MYIFEKKLFEVSKIVNKISTQRINLFEWYFLAMHKHIQKKLNLFYKSATRDSGMNGDFTKTLYSNTVWVFWDGPIDKSPEVVQICVNNLIRIFGDRVVVLNKKSVKTYVEIPNFIYQKVENGQISMTHFSDILRMALIANCGGFWVDATVLVISSKQIDCGINTFYTTKRHSTGLFNVAQSRWTGFYIGGENFRETASFCYNFFLEYWKKNTNQINYFLIDYALDESYRDNIGGFRDLIEKLPITNSKMFALMDKLQYEYDDNTDYFEDTAAFKLSYKKTINLDTLRLLIEKI